jgi:hypothetical protein
MAEEKVKTFTNGEIPHLAELSDDRLVSFKKERLQYKADLEAANRNKTENARTNMRTVAQSIEKMKSKKSFSYQKIFLKLKKYFVEKNLWNELIVMAKKYLCMLNEVSFDVCKMAFFFLETSFTIFRH